MTELAALLERIQSVRNARKRFLTLGGGGRRRPRCQRAFRAGSALDRLAADVAEAGNYASASRPGTARAASDNPFLGSYGKSRLGSSFQLFDDQP